MKQMTYLIQVIYMVQALKIHFKMKITTRTKINIKAMMFKFMHLEHSTSRVVMNNKRGLQYTTKKTCPSLQSLEKLKRRF